MADFHFLGLPKKISLVSMSTVDFYSASPKSASASNALVIGGLGPLSPPDTPLSLTKHFGTNGQ